MLHTATLVYRRRATLLALALLLALAVSLVGGLSAAPRQASAAGARATTTLHILNDAPWHSPGFAAASSVTAQKFGVNLKVDLYANNEDAFQSAVKLGLGSSHPPAAFEWWFGYRMQDLASTGHLVDLTPLWQKYIKQGAYSAAQMKLFSANGHAYGVPLFLDYWVMFYNKHVFDQYHLTAPTTWSGLMETAATLKAHGVTPFGLDTGDCTWCGFIWFEELLVRSDPGLYMNLLSGKVKYTDPAVVHVMQIWQDMLNKGYFSNPGITGNGLLSAFAKGKVAMSLWGDWEGPIYNQQAGLQPGVDFGSFVVPGITAKGNAPLIAEARPMLLGKGAAQQSDAMKVADYLMSTAGQTLWAKTLKVNPVNLAVGPSYRPSYLVQLANDVSSGKYTLYPRYWEGTAPQLSEAVSNLMDKFTVHPSDLQSILSQAQSLADQYLTTK
jgi:multiple sugar transport system substrate-binding protein